MNEIKKIENGNIIDIIRIIRGTKVVLDFDLAQLYGVETRVLKQAYDLDYLLRKVKEEGV